jgi:hypothetical protein
MPACSRYRFKCWGRTANPYISLQSLIPQQQQQQTPQAQNHIRKPESHPTLVKKIANAPMPSPKNKPKKPGKKKGAPTLRRASNSSCRLFPLTPGHCGPEFQHHAYVCVLLTTDQIPSPSPTSLSPSLALACSRSSPVRFPPLRMI